MDKGNFIQEVEQRLGVDFPSLAEDSTRAVFRTLHRRLGPGQAGHIESHLPQDLKDAWELGSAEKVKHVFKRGAEGLDKHEFLEAVKKEAHFRNTDEAYHATRAVFGVLKQVLPEKDVRDTAQELSSDLREIWQQAA